MHSEQTRPTTVHDQLLMMDGIDEPERKEYVRTILGSGQALMTILNDILDLSKVEAGKLELQSTHSG